jgi:PPOX class probable FMN-dependent enzyme
MTPPPPPMELAHRIESVEQLTAQFRPPNERVLEKQLDRINPAMAMFIDHVSFVVLATSDGTGSMDASPRGGPPGFIRRLDDRRIAIPDLAGNNRIDSFRNIIRYPYAGLLLMVPGQDETLRINGPAALTTDPALLDGFTKDLRTPKAALVVETAEIYGHCAKSFRRGSVWQPENWLAVEDVPDLPAMYSCVWDLDEDALRQRLSESYEKDLAAD